MNIVGIIGVHALSTIKRHGEGMSHAGDAVSLILWRWIREARDLSKIKAARLFGSWQFECNNFVAVPLLSFGAKVDTHVFDDRESKWRTRCVNDNVYN